MEGGASVIGGGRGGRGHQLVTAFNINCLLIDSVVIIAKMSMLWYIYCIKGVSIQVNGQFYFSLAPKEVFSFVPTA